MSAVEIIAFIVLFIISYRKYDDLLAIADSKKYKLKLLLPAGLHLFSLFNHRYNTHYEKTLEARLRTLHGPLRAKEYLKIHIAHKTLLLMFVQIFLSVVFSQMQIDVPSAFFSITVIASLFYATDKQLDSALKEKTRKMQIDFPEFLNKLILLVNAGLSVSGAVQKIVRDAKKDSPLYSELSITLNEVKSGKPEAAAFEDFARRCRLQEITLFSAALIQNLRKGNDELIPILRLQAGSCWENRKNIARKLGEEASTKLTIPMVIMFVAILLMLMTPAVMQLNF